MGKPVPPKEQQPKPAGSRAGSSAAAAPKATAAGRGVQTDAKPAPQVSRPRVIDSAAPSHEQIAQKAYEIWLSQGMPHGADCENWLEAERQLRSANGSQHGSPARK